MKKHFDKNLVVKVDKENEKVTLSIKTTENKVEVFKLSLQDFSVMVAEFTAENNK